MRLRKEMIERISDRIVMRLLGKDLISPDLKIDVLKTRMSNVIEEDLLVEDRLNEEVKEILYDFQNEMDEGKVDYSRMFSMVKTRIARERNLIL
ncbi:MAG: DUF507 family protein [Nitrospinota bacterium]|nr:DUF507 family protein [Nitrospinota bacterium]